MIWGIEACIFDEQIKLHYNERQKYLIGLKKEGGTGNILRGGSGGVGVGE